jgi:phosphatidylglycerophosphate synthase
MRVRDHRDGQAWGRFVEIYSPLVFAYCRKRGLQDEDAADVVQDVFLGVAGSIVLLTSAALDLVDGTVSRIRGTGTKFGAVFDWIVDKYVDTLALLASGCPGSPSSPGYTLPRSVGRII